MAHDTLLGAELIDVFQEMCCGSRRIGSEEIPVEMQGRHHASRSLNNRISIAGAIFS